MGVVSTSNLVSSENEKKKKRKTACDFQTMAINSFVIPHDLMRGQMGTYAYLQQTSSYL